MMTRNFFLRSAVVLLFLVNDPSLAGGYCEDQQKDCDNIGIQETRSQQLSDLSTDFETGSQNFWTDASHQTGVRWKIEDSNSTWELNNPAPKPLVGRNYMRVNRGVSLSFGVAVLRSPTIQIPPSSSNDSKISFDFWIRSKWPQFTNLELYLNENGNEKLLVSLLEYSKINNTNWVTYQFSVLPFSNGSEFSLAFYAYCGTDVEDAVAIDNIRWINASSTVTTPTTPIWTHETTSLTTKVVTVDTTTTATEKTTTELWTERTTTGECHYWIYAIRTDTNITSTGYPDFYETNQSCFYHVGAEHVFAVIRLRFNDIDMGTDDFVKVYDGQSINSPEILKLTGNSSVPDYYEPPKAVVDCQSGYCIIEHFSGSSPKGNLRGWRATYSECGGYYNVFETEISITSPNYPNFYHTKQTCNYTIYSSFNNKIRLEIIDFHIEAQHDWFKVYDGPTRNSPLLFQATGYPGFNAPFNQLPDSLPHSIISSGSEILMEHISDYSDQGSLKGWSVNIIPN